MKIAIFTQPLTTNYGGLLQNFAMQKILKNMGHDPWTVDFHAEKLLRKDFKIFAVRFLRKYFFRRKGIKNIFHIRPTVGEQEILSQHASSFVRENIQTTERITSVNKLHLLRNFKFDAYIVGSDQVWRPRYSPGLSAFYLDFLENDNTIKRIAYAASFGVDNWEYNVFLTRKCRKLAQKFDAISVREDSAVELSRKYLGVNAVHLLDPTMLLNTDEYIDLFDKNLLPRKKKSLAVYLLDKTKEKINIIKKISRVLNLESYSLMPSCKYSEKNRSNIDDCIFPPISFWLEGFFESDFIVTDSFHGVVFSILFNKPFFVIGNHARGLARIYSLTKMFGLGERIVFSVDDLKCETINSHINFDKINKILQIKRLESLDFLKRSLV